MNGVQEGGNHTHLHVTLRGEKASDSLPAPSHTRRCWRLRWDGSEVRQYLPRHHPGGAGLGKSKVQNGTQTSAAGCCPVFIFSQSTSVTFVRVHCAPNAWASRSIIDVEALGRARPYPLVWVQIFRGSRAENSTSIAFELSRNYGINRRTCQQHHFMS